jgi:hypothetical protein
VRGWLPLLALALLATPADAEPVEAFGYMGHLGEWELSATLSPTGSPWSKQLSGSLVLKHVGICTQDGPEQKTGELRLQISWFASIQAELKIDGIACTFRARSSDAYQGFMNCPDRSPLPLTLWLR